MIFGDFPSHVWLPKGKIVTPGEQQPDVQIRMGNMIS